MTGAAAIEHVHVPYVEDHGLWFAHVLGRKVKVLVHHREVVLVPVGSLVDPPHHGLPVPEVRFGDERDVDNSVAGIAQELEGLGNELPVPIRPERHVVLDGQRVR